MRDLPDFMNNLKRFLSSWQGLFASVVAVFIYFGSARAIRWVDPTAGVFDAGFLHWISLAMVVYFVAIFCAWTGWQIAFRSMDKWADLHLWAAFRDLSDMQKFWAVQGTFSFMLVLFVWVLKSIPV